MTYPFYPKTDVLLAYTNQHPLANPVILISGSAPELSTATRTVVGPIRLSGPSPRAQQARAALGEALQDARSALEEVRRQFANSKQEQLQALAQDVKVFVRDRHSRSNRQKHDHDVAMFVGRSAGENSHLAERVVSGEFSSLTLPFTMLPPAVQEQRIKHTGSMEEQSVANERAAKGLYRTETTNGHGNGSRAERLGRLSGMLTVRSTGLCVPTFSDKCSSPLSKQLLYVLSKVATLRDTYQEKHKLSESKTVGSAIVSVETAVSDAGRFERLRAECARSVRETISLGFEFVNGLPLAFLARDLFIGTIFALGRVKDGFDEKKKEPIFRKSPLYSRIDLLFFDLLEQCFVLADTSAIPQLDVSEPPPEVAPLPPPPLEYQFVKRLRILQLHMQALLLEHNSHGRIRVGYLLLPAFDANASHAFATFRVEFQPKFFLLSRFENSDLFYDSPPHSRDSAKASDLRPIAHYRTDLVAPASSLPLLRPILTNEDMEALAPHRMQVSPRTTLS